MLEATLIQKALDEIQGKYSNGLITIGEKLVHMVAIVDDHIEAHNIQINDLSCDDGEYQFADQYEKAVFLLNQNRRIERFTKKLNLYV